MTPSPLLRRLNLLHLAALGLIGSPLLVLLALGIAWLWQADGQRWRPAGGHANRRLAGRADRTPVRPLQKRSARAHGFSIHGGIAPFGP